LDILEYKVTAVNRNGEGPASRIVDTDANSWRNWDPVLKSRFGVLVF